MALKEETHKAVPKNYKGVVRLKPSKAYPSCHWHAYVKLERGYRYTGHLNHGVVIRFYKTYQDLTNNNRHMGEGFVEERSLYVPRKRKNNYW